MSTAQAAAYPIHSAKLLDNPLYEAGRLPKTTCDEPPVKRNNVKLGRAYVNAVVACLETTWEQHLKDADLPYDKVKVQFVKKFPKKFCGIETDKSDSQAYYCDGTRTMAFQLGKDYLSEVDDLWLFYWTSYLYGEHVQNLVGINQAYEDAPYDKRAELLEQNRRVTLQADCLSGAFMQSVWPMKGRTTKDFKHLLSIIEGDEPGDERWYGKVSTVRSWIKRGFSTGDPASCNTWKASPAKVA